MNQPAWLEDLSEDWPSSPEATTRQPIMSTPRSSPSKSSHFQESVGSSHVLSERSFSQINVPAAGTRHPSKLSHTGTRSMSGSSDASVVHNTCQRHDMESPVKGETPEWKRRLIQGQLGTGEQPDLFTSARTGLEGLFAPPSAAHRPDTTMPSSPPAFATGGSEHTTEEANAVRDDDADDDASNVIYPPEKKTADMPSALRYRMVDGEHSELENTYGSHESVLDASELSESKNESSNFSEVPLKQLSNSASLSSRMLQPPRQPALGTTDLSRKVSTQSDMRNEDLSPIMVSPQKGQDGRITFAPVTGEFPPSLLHNKLETLRRNQMALASQLGDRKGNIDCSREGKPAEDSFRRRHLSPYDTSDMLPEDSLQASTPKQFPAVAALGAVRGSLMPRAPFPSPEKQVRGSPLRNVASLVHEGLNVPSPPPNCEEISAELELALRSELEVPHTPPQLDRLAAQERQMSQQTAEKEVPTQHSALEEETELDPMDKENQPPHNQLDQSLQGTRTTLNFGASALKKFNFSVEAPQERPGLVLHAMPKQDGITHDSKRPRSSPSKNPTPKRRRTLHESDVAYGLQPGEVDVSNNSMSSSSERKRQSKGSRPRNQTPGRHMQRSQQADAYVLAQRQMLRPRNPTPRTCFRESQRHLDESVDCGDESNLGDSSAISEASASFAAPLRTPRSALRKPSIKTQDFLHEAEEIMAMIRNKARPAQLPSVEESELENSIQEQPFEAQSQESSVEPVSRPPSREGRPVPRQSTRQDDPILLQRLKMYEERSEMGDLITSSLRSVGLAKEAMAIAAQAVDEANETLDLRASIVMVDESEVIASDPPNIRITSNPHIQSQGLGSQPAPGSNNGSLASTAPSATSRMSETCKTIPPQNVSHLIPDHVGNMVLDRENNMWVKQKPLKTPISTVRSRSLVVSEDSEDDPFASIPDLSVDETLEMRNVKFNVGRQAAAAGGSQPQYIEIPSPTARGRALPKTLKSSLKRPPPSRLLINNNETLLENDKEVEREITVHEDRLKSSPPRKKHLTISFTSPIASIIAEAVKRDATKQEQERYENSSPVVSPVSPSPPGNLSNGSVKSSKYGSIGGSLPRPKGALQGPGRATSRRISLGAALPFRPHPREITRIEERDEDELLTPSNLPETCPAISSDTSNALVPCDNSDQDTASANDCGPLVSADHEVAANTSVSFLVTPLTNKFLSRHASRDNGPIISQCVGTLSLSPLSEFTINHGDQSMGLELSYIVGDHRLVTGTGDKRVLSLSVKDLVSRIAEVVPFEPNWETLTGLDIANKSLKSLHKLDEFCGGLITLDASENQIAQLDGVPSSVRNLKITDNCLSELTGWSHLEHLQYLDVSNNELGSLAALKGLVHLRDIKADNNKIRSLSHLLFHDGIQSLRARGNALEHLDFEGTTMYHLTDLDLEDNQINSISHIDALQSLSSLNLKRNQLASLATHKKHNMPSLKLLDLTDNRLTTFDLSTFPSLRMFHADRNHITNLTGLARARRLDSLSLREQRTSSSTFLDNSFLAQICEVRKLFLSGNFLSSFEPYADFLNLQYLEIANCGLAVLPKSLGHMMPNLRVLNVNFNALSDLRPLCGIPRLKKLLVAGNRLGMARDKVIIPLSGFPHLRELDMRDNPCTIGFYPPIRAVVPMSLVSSKDCRRASNGSSAARRGQQQSRSSLHTDSRHPSTTTTSTVTAPGPFELPRCEMERDELFASRLDTQTRMRRRLYEILLTGACTRLRWLDGLLAPVGIATVYDDVWKALCKQGLVNGNADKQCSSS